MPRLEHLRGEVPRDLESSVFFSEDFFKPAERKGKADGTWGLPRGACSGGRRGGSACCGPRPLPCTLQPGVCRPRGKGSHGGALQKLGWFITW